jgi:hypothetical protein
MASGTKVFSNPLARAGLLNVVPFALAFVAVGFVGFGPCGPTVAPRVRSLLTGISIIALASYFSSLYWYAKSFMQKRFPTIVVGLPLITLGAVVSIYWIFIFLSAVQ